MQCMLMIFFFFFFFFLTNMATNKYVQIFRVKYGSCLAELRASSLKKTSMRRWSYYQAILIL